jgi:hypothetical protein
MEITKWLRARRFGVVTQRRVITTARALCAGTAQA